MKETITTDGSVTNMYILADNVKSLITTNTETDKLYSAYADTENGSISKNDAYNFYLFGNESAADSAMGTSSDDYGLRLVRHMKDYSAYLIVDIDKEVVRVLKECHEKAFNILKEIVTHLMNRRISYQ